VLNNNANLLLEGMITAFCPTPFIERIFMNNKNKRSFWGDNRACLTISFDCDYPGDVEAIPSLLKTLSRHAIKTSFACVGHWIEKYPREHRMLLDDGHELVNHTYSHPDNELLNPGRKFREISRQEKMEEVARCHEICRRVLHYEPTGCRIPHFKRLFTQTIYGILKELGYRYSSSTWLTNTASYGMPFTAPEGIIEFPLTTCPEHPFSVFDTWHSFNSPRLAYRLSHRSEERYVTLFKYLVDLAVETNSYINIYIDPNDVPKMKRFDELLAYVREKDIRVARYEDL
jgi:peptidoglycan/xylan/chitin deacetylase (PgdA/CDA1 family)